MNKTNVKDQIINEILAETDMFLDIAQQQKLADVLSNKLYSYEIVRKVTEITSCDIYSHDVIKMYFAGMKISGRSLKTIRLYGYRLRTFFDDVNKPIKDITSEDIRYFLYKHQAKNNCCNTTLNNYRGILSSFFTWCFVNEYIDKNPILKVDNIKKDTKKEKPYSPIEIEKLRHACCGNLKARALVEFMLATGCRVSEVCSIKLSDMDFTNKQATIVGKGNKQRTICFTDETIYHLQRYIKNRKYQSEYLFNTSRKKNENYDVTKTTEDDIRGIIKRIGNKANVKGVHPHRFRRTFCCTLLNHGTPIQTVQTLMGHSNINTTLVYYNNSMDKIKYEYKIAIA